MIKKFTFLLVCIFLTGTMQLNSQSLPKQWEGKWVGTVEIWSYNVKKDAFPMTLEIIPNDSIWDYTIFYDKEYQGKKDIRKYQLIQVDEEQFRFAIDEKNSIILDCYLIDNCMYDRFSGMGSDLHVRMCLVNEHEMEYEITSYLNAPVRTSGGEVIKKDTIPEIQSFNLYHLMKAKLKKEE